jgi:hypothetical protein
MAQTMTRLTLSLDEVLDGLDLTPEEIEYVKGMKLGPYEVTLPHDGVASGGRFIATIESPQAKT